MSSETHGSGSVFGVLRTFILERRVRRQAFLGALFACLAAGASVGLVGLAGWFIAASALAGISGAATFVVAYPSSGIRAFAVARVILRYLERLTNHRVTFSLLSLLRVYFFERALRIPAARYQRYRSGDLLGRATSDVDALDNVFPRVIVPTLAASVVCAGSCTVLAYFSPTLALILALGCCVSGLALPLVTNFAGRSSGTSIARSRARLRTEMVESVEGLPEVRSYGAGAVIAARLNEAADEAAEAERGAKLVDAAGTALRTLASQVTVLAVLIVGVLLYRADGISGALVAFAVLLAMGVFEQLGTLPAAYRALGVTRAAASRLSEIFEREEDDSGFSKSSVPSGRHGFGISVRDATLRYEDRESAAIERISFDVAAGGVTVLVGPSGSGKTSLLRLIAGEIRPDSGEVEIGGVRAGEIDHEELVRHVAYVAQDEHIFDATLRENLLIAAPETPDEVLHYVLDTVGLTEFYEGLDDGLDLRLGEHGRTTSGGQRRRIAIARALLRKPDILLLDEPTGSLDDATAKRMLLGIRENLPSATVVVASHHVDTVLDMFPDADVVKLVQRSTDPTML